MFFVGTVHYDLDLLRWQAILVPYYIVILQSLVSPVVFSKDVRQHPSWQQGLRQGMFEDEAVRIDHQSIYQTYIFNLPAPTNSGKWRFRLGFPMFFQSDVILVVFSLASWGWDPTYHVYRQELLLEMSWYTPSKWSTDWKITLRITQSERKIIFHPPLCLGSKC